MGSFAAGAGTQFVVTSTYSGPFTINAGTTTTNTPALNVTQTWNNAAVTFTGWQFNVTDTASNAASLLMDLQIGGTSRFSVRKDGRISGAVANAYLNSLGGYWAVFSANSFVGQMAASTSIGGTSTGFHAISFGLTTSEGAAPDVVLARDAANTLAQRNGTNAQTFNIYNTFTDASNYERTVLRWSGNVAGLFTDQAGTGITRKLQLGTLGASPIDFVINGSARWQITGAGDFVANTDNTNDIGASAANRPRTVYAGTSVLAPYVRTSTAYTVATLPAAGTAGAGARAYVTDANATTFASIVAGGGANIVPVMSNGTNWIIG